MSFRNDINLPEGIIRKGKYFALPFENETIQKVEGCFHIFFFKRNKRLVKLDIQSDFDIYLNEEKYSSTSLGEYLIDLFCFLVEGKKILKAQTDKYGNLEIHIEGNIRLFIKDGPFENWHYTDIKKSIFLHGGCGRFIC